MARYASDHKPATRLRMIEAAGRRFKTDGIDGSGVATLVADVGLTNGAFYGHFDSKDHLVAEVVANQLAAQAAWIRASPPSRGSLDGLIEAYLSTDHRDDRPGGCPSAALLSEIGRRDAGTRRAYTAGTQQVIDAIALHLESAGASNARRTAMGLFAMLVGALQTSRAIDDPELSLQVLESAQSQAATIIDAARRPS